MKRLGIDIGSTTVKVAVIDEQHNILFSDYQRHFAKIQETLSSLLKKAKDQIGEMTFAPTVTGSGGLSISSQNTYIFHSVRKLSVYQVHFRIMHLRQMLPLSLVVKMLRSFISQMGLINV